MEDGPSAKATGVMGNFMGNFHGQPNGCGFPGSPNGVRTRVSTLRA
jgi:hypothetical protein